MSAYDKRMLALKLERHPLHCITETRHTENARIELERLSLHCQQKQRHTENARIELESYRSTANMKRGIQRMLALNWRRDIGSTANRNKAYKEFSRGDKALLTP
ncbi:hypothetical protein RRG08_046128 [Elysia crispata]|uniref:Uncharacterized protein n=1 Tax=Elysia crispata TaxID=231223 RepID=A0AAE1AZ80_9GAST|nr:hypothetical protein RRG08_046128 [Elysia crispata]